MCLFLLLLLTLFASLSFSVTNLTISNYTLPDGVSRFALGAFNNQLIVFGGETQPHSNKTFEYRLPTTDMRNYNHLNAEWIIKDISDTVPYGAHYVTTRYTEMVSIPGTSLVYIAMPGLKPITCCCCGQFSHRALSIYNLSLGGYVNTSTYIAFPGYPVRTGSCVAFSSLFNVLFSIGDIGASPPYFCIAYNLSSDAWYQCSDANQIAWEFGCAMDAQSQLLFRFGGITPPLFVSLSSIERYNISNDSWHLLRNVTLAQPKHHVSCIVFFTFDQNIYCAGGGIPDSDSTSIEIFNPTNLTIESAIYQMNVKRFGVWLVVTDQCILFVGGWSDGVEVNIIEYLCPANPSTTTSPTSYVIAMYMFIHTLSFCSYFTDA